MEKYRGFYGLGSGYFFLIRLMIPKITVARRLNNARTSSVVTDHPPFANGVEECPLRPFLLTGAVYQIPQNLSIVRLRAISRTQIAL